VENKFMDTDKSMKCISKKVISIEITSSTGKYSTVTSNSNIKLIESLVNPWRMAEIVLICRPCCLAHFLFNSWADIQVNHVLEHAVLGITGLP
jgi:hypothetical protein